VTDGDWTSIEGIDGTVVSYRERMTPPWPVWLVATALCASLSIAYGYRLGLLVGVITFIAIYATSVVLLWTTSPIVVVDDRGVRAGRARLPLVHVGRIAPLDAQHTRDALGVRADVRSFRCTRGWISTSVIIEVDDPADPHPTWVVSTRDGHAFASALAAARDQFRGPQGL